MSNIEGMAAKFFVLKNEDIKKHLTLEQKIQLREMEQAINAGRSDEGKRLASSNIYLVINTDEQYAVEVIETLKRHGHWGDKTARETLREWGFEEHVLAEWDDEECQEQLKAFQMYPEG